MANYKKTKKKILALLEAIAEGAELFTLSYRYQKAFMFDGLEGVKRVRDAVERKQLRRELAYLKRKKLIEEHRRGERVLYCLTDEGKRRLLCVRVRQAPLRADGSLTIVIFDIPESERAARDAFRWFLRENGFRRLQQSVWATNRSVTQPLLEFIRSHKLATWINLIEGRVLLGDADFRRKLKREQKK